jgi:hypothetical protein
MGFRAGSNFYSYTANNPTNFSDPLGLCRQECLENLYNSPPGTIVQYLSVISLTPLNPNYRSNWEEWAETTATKTTFLVSIGYEQEPTILTLAKEATVATTVEAVIVPVVTAIEETVPYAIAAATAADAIIQFQCTFDPDLRSLPMRPFE